MLPAAPPPCRSCLMFPGSLAPALQWLVREPGAGSALAAAVDAWCDKCPKHGRDGTRYSKIRRGISYIAHHMQTISAAAVIGDAANIDIGITRLKMHVQALTPTGDSAA